MSSAARAPLCCKHVEGAHHTASQGGGAYLSDLPRVRSGELQAAQESTARPARGCLGHQLRLQQASLKVLESRLAIALLQPKRSATLLTMLCVLLPNEARSEAEARVLQMHASHQGELRSVLAPVLAPHMTCTV